MIFVNKLQKNLPGKRVNNGSAIKWQSDLQSWAIPKEILDQAEEAPWVHPPALFALPSKIADSPSHVKAREVISETDSILDIGCGGGVATFAVAKRGNHVIGVDHQAEMLKMYSQNAKSREISSEVHEGFWPAIADQVPVADVVTVHHVVYNVGEIEPFLKAIDKHARKRVVIELPLVHPMTSASAGWKHFWNLARPTSPNADELFLVLKEMGIIAHIEKFSSDFPLEQSAEDIAERTRVRLCLPPSRLDEVKEFLVGHPFASKRDLAVIWWDKV
jgi:ubiquinone/menaquinone biosynthesis C-methylase UbiE